MHVVQICDPTGGRANQVLLFAIQSKFGRVFMEPFEELSEEIMRLLQAQLNALDINRVLTAKQLLECQQRRTRIRKLIEHLHEFNTHGGSAELELEAMARKT